MEASNDAETRGSRAKRPRVGRHHADILSGIDNDTAASFGRPRHLRGLFLHVGEKRKEEDTTAIVLVRQASELAAAFTADGDETLNLLLEA